MVIKKCVKKWWLNWKVMDTLVAKGKVKVMWKVMLSVLWWLVYTDGTLMSWVMVLSCLLRGNYDRCAIMHYISTWYYHSLHAFLTAVNSCLLGIFMLNWLLQYATTLVAELSSIHSGYFYSASSNPLLYRGAPNRAQQATASEGLAQSPFVAARAPFEPVTLRTKGDESTKAKLIR